VGCIKVSEQLAVPSSCGQVTVEVPAEVPAEMPTSGSTHDASVPQLCELVSTVAPRPRHDYRMDNRARPAVGQRSESLLCWIVTLKAINSENDIIWHTIPTDCRSAIMYSCRRVMTMQWGCQNVLRTTKYVTSLGALQHAEHPGYPLTLSLNLASLHE
jgi:hypothetical protein